MHIGIWTWRYLNSNRPNLSNTACWIQTCATLHLVTNTKRLYRTELLVFQEGLLIGTHLRGIKLLPGNRLSWVAHMCDPIQSVPIDFPSEYRKFWRFFYIFWNPTICNIIRWFAGPMGQITRRPSVWLSKHFFSFFIISYRLRALKSLFFIFVI